MVELTWEESGVVRTASGVVTSEDLDRTAIQIQGSARTDDLQYIIHDFSAITDAQVSGDDIDFMGVRAAIALQRNTRVKIAFVGTHPLVHGLIDAFNRHAGENARCHRFDTLAQAREFTVVPGRAPR